MKALRLISNHISKALSVAAIIVLAAVGAPEAKAQLERTTFFPAVQVQPAGTTYDVVVGVKLSGSYGLPVTFVSSDPSVARVKGAPVFYGEGSFPKKYGGIEGYWGIVVATIEVLGQPISTTTITATQAGISLRQQLTVAGGTPANVAYGPYSANSEGGMPRSDAYNVRVYRPDGTSGAETISFTVQPVQDPLNNSALTASFVYVTPATVSFAAGELFKDVVVTCRIPPLNIPPGSTVTFVYKVPTSGWSVPVGDNGFALNATVTAPPPADSAPPVVVILEPSQLVYGPYSAGGVPATLPLSFQALTAAPGTITSVDATITSTSFSAPQSRTITLTEGTHVSGLRTQTSTAITTQMPISGAGVYTVMAAGVDSNGRRTEATKTFTVVVATPTPPTVVINSPTPGSTFVRTFGTNPWTILFAFTAHSPGGVIRTVSATLDNSSTPIVVTPVPFGLNAATVTASANLNLNTGGVHTLTVTVTDSMGGTATTTGTFTINLLQASPIVSWSDPAPITYGTQLSRSQLNATVSRGVSGTMAYTPASGAVLPVGNRTLSVTFTPTDTVNYLSVTKTVELTVNPAPLTITANNKTMVAGGSLPTLTTSYVGLLGSDVVSGFVPTTTATAASPVGTYPITIGTGTAPNYTVTRVNGTLTITAKASQTITFGALPAKNFGDAPFALTATASSGLQVSFTSSNPAVATVSVSTVTILRAGITTITASQPGNATYSAALPVSRTLTVDAGTSQPCAVLHWLPPISLDKEKQKGGSMVPIRFHLHACCRSNGDVRDDDHGDDHGDDRRDDDHGDDDNGSKSKSKSSSAKTNGGNSSSNHDCDEDDRRDDDRHDGWKDNGNGHCPLVKDTTVIITVYEVGQPSSAVLYTYSAKGNPKAPTYTIDGDKVYHLDFSTAKGVHRYHIDVDYFPTGTTVPVLIDSKEFTTK
jgi:hypothetical protein